MANWVRTFLDHNPDLAVLPVIKRDRRSIHFSWNGQTRAFFTGKPIHYLDNGIWLPIDTTLRDIGGGFYGSPGLDVLINANGIVKVRGSNYVQYTPLPGEPVGKVDGDQIIREFHGGRQRLILTEDGFREIIELEHEVSSPRDLVARTHGILPARFKRKPITIFTNERIEVTDDILSWLKHPEYPAIIDPDFTGDEGDAWIYGMSFGSYSTARSTTTAFGDTTNYNRVGQSYAAFTYVTQRSFLKFDTSSIPDSATINQVNLKLTCIADQSTTDFDVQIVKQSWSGQDPITNSNRETAYDNCLGGTADDSIWRNTSGMSTNTQYESGNLSTAWIVKDGVTYYSLRSSRDYGNNTPTGNEYIDIASEDHSTSSYRPVLAVTYTSNVLTADVRSYTLTGIAATMLRALVLAASPLSISLVGNSATLFRNVTISCATGTYEVTGVISDLFRSWLVSAASGSFIATGISAGFTRTYILAAAVGEYLLTGQDAGLQYVNYYYLYATPQSFSLSGQDASLLKGSLLSAGTGTYEITGQSVSLSKNYILAGSTSGIAVTFLGSSLLFGRLLSAVLVEFVLLGLAADLRRTRKLQATRQTYTVTTVAASLRLSDLADSFSGELAHPSRHSNRVRLDRHVPKDIDGRTY